jgi:hypothetical protein
MTEKRGCTPFKRRSDAILALKTPGQKNREIEMGSSFLDLLTRSRSIPFLWKCTPEVTGC